MSDRLMQTILREMAIGPMNTFAERLHKALKEILSDAEAEHELQYRQTVINTLNKTIRGLESKKGD